MAITDDASTVGIAKNCEKAPSMYCSIEQIDLMNYYESMYL